MKLFPALLVSIFSALICPLAVGVVIDATDPATKSSITKASERQQKLSLADTPAGRRAERNTARMPGFSPIFSCADACRRARMQATVSRGLRL